MNELVQVKNTGLVDWNNQEELKEIRVLFAPKLTDAEFKFFVGVGQVTSLNPFLREIWAIKYDAKAPAQIFIGRDGYRKTAQKNRDYDYHQVDSVYSGDDFSVKNGEVEHSYQLKDRGELLGAYCVVKKHSSSRPTYVFVELKEYDTGQSNWRKMKPTMIKKVAEAQCLRSAFPSDFGGTYDEAEDYTQGKNATPKRERAADLLAEAIQVKELVTAEKAVEIGKLFAKASFGEDRQMKALNYFNAESIATLTSEDADKLILMLEGQ